MGGLSIGKNKSKMKMNQSDTALRARLRDIYEDYAQILDDEDLDGWARFFTQDCYYRVTSRENYDNNLPIGFITCMNKDMIHDRITALRETTVYQPRQMRHFVSGVRINKIDDDIIEAQANFMVTESLSDAEPIISVVGQYKDRLIASGETFQFTYRDCILDNYRINTSLIMPI